MAKSITTFDNTYFYVIIVLTLLLGLALLKIYVMLSVSDSKIEKLSEKINEKINENKEDQGPSGVSLEEKIKEHLDSLEDEEILETIEEISDE